MSFRVGTGYDVHRLVRGRKLVLGGVVIPFDRGLAGHSDADVLLHAVSDAILGAASLGDIGLHFPDSDPKWKDVDSVVLLEEVVALARKGGYKMVNVDATIVMESPRLRPYIDAMRERIAGATGLNVADVSVKATTTEGLGFVGAGEGVAAHAVCLLAADG